MRRFVNAKKAAQLARQVARSRGKAARSVVTAAHKGAAVKAIGSALQNANPAAPIKAQKQVNVNLNSSNTRAISSLPDTLPQVPFKRLMAANRGEIATRILRGGSELGLETVAIFSNEDRFTQHRYKADQAFMVGKGKSPVAAYLDVKSIVETAKANGVDCVHPGYGFLSERDDFAEACEKAGITFVGPTVENLRMFGDKTSARELAIKSNVPVVPGTPGPVTTVDEARAFVEGEGVGYPVIIKAAMGGGGRGMRVVEKPEELEESVRLASSEALAAFGDGSIFIERYVYKPRHIEVQILGDGKGNVVHLYDRDCSVQRRHQKVVETAPAMDLPEATRNAMFEDAKRLTSEAKYRNAGTVEFLVDGEGRHYFIEVNPRIQVEHTVTEEVTGIDIVQSQIRIAGGASLEDLGLTQDNISATGCAMQCRVTTEDASQGFSPDTGVIEVFRSPGGMGIRIDDGPGFVGAHITPHYDSLLVKITSHAATRMDAAKKLERALKEFRVRGVQTNKSFLLNVLSHPDFLYKTVNTGFIGDHPQLLEPEKSRSRGQKLLKYIGDVIVNGPDPTLGASGPRCEQITPVIPELGVPPPRHHSNGKDASLRSIFVKDGPDAFAKAVRETKGLLITDTTWRDAHQSLLATRVRTKDLLTIAPATSVALRDAFSLECWGGATFDVSMRFLKECPWERLAALREAVPDIPFQMLLRGANAVGYTSYPDNVVYEFCKLAKETGMDVFRVFDSLNYLENMRLGIDAVGAGGGIAEAGLCYTGDISDPQRGSYDLEYYLAFATELHKTGAHVLGIKDMAGLLKPAAASQLVSALRAEFPQWPIHIHTHDTAGTGVATYLACAKAGADAVDVAVDSMSGTTSQPSMGALVESLKHTAQDSGLYDMNEINQVNEFWEECRGLYAPFESGQKSGGADVYVHEMPGGQYTNLLFQSKQLGMTGKWAQIKRSYASANRLLGDIIKVTPSSKVVGDMAQFMVQNDLDEASVLERAEELSFPNSVVEYFQGYLGIPPFGFPEPLRSKVLKGKTLPSGKDMFDGRPGAEMAPYDFDGQKKMLVEKYGPSITDCDVMSHAQYPAVFADFMESKLNFDDLSKLDTPTFVEGMSVGQEKAIEIEHGKVLYVKLMTVGDIDEDGIRDVIFSLNGQKRVIRVKDKSANVETVVRERADPRLPGSIGAPMPGVIVDVKVKVGDVVKKGQPLATMSAMKMETSVNAPVDGKVANLPIGIGEHMAAGDLIALIE